jgi:hypothetical protein
MVAFEAVVALSGKQGVCTGGGDLSCVAVTKDDGTVSLVFWDFNWTSTRFPDDTTAAIGSHQIVVQPGANVAAAYIIQEAQLDSGTWDQAANPIVVGTNGASVRLTIQVPYGSYGKISLKPN